MYTYTHIVTFISPDDDNDYSTISHSEIKK